MPFIENWFYKYLKDLRWGFSKKTSKQCKKGNLVVMFHPYAAYLLSATLYNVSHGGTHPQEPGSVSECYLIQPEHLVRPRKLLMYYQSLSLFFSLTKEPPLSFLPSLFFALWWLLFQMLSICGVGGGGVTLTNPLFIWSACNSSRFALSCSLQ